MAFDLDWSTLIISLGIAIPLLIVTIVITIVIVCVCKRKRSTPKSKRLDFVKVHCMSLYFAVCLFFSFFNFCPPGRLVDETFIETYLSVWQFYYPLSLILNWLFLMYMCVSFAAVLNENLIIRSLTPEKKTFRKNTLLLIHIRVSVAATLTKFRLK